MRPIIKPSISTGGDDSSQLSNLMFFQRSYPFVFYLSSPLTFLHYKSLKYMIRIWYICYNLMCLFLFL